MDLTNEIHFDPVSFINYNLDPTRRYGSETSATVRASDTLLFRGGFAYTRAVFREGPFTGNDVPLVSPLTASAGVTWNAWQKYLVVDATVRYWSSRRMDNDQPNTQPLIPASATVDFKGWAANTARYFWSVSVRTMCSMCCYTATMPSRAHSRPTGLTPIRSRAGRFASRRARRSEGRARLVTGWHASTGQ